MITMDMQSIHVKVDQKQLLFQENIDAVRNIDWRRSAYDLSLDRDILRRACVRQQSIQFYMNIWLWKRSVLDGFCITWPKLRNRLVSSKLYLSVYCIVSGVKPS